MDIQSGDDHGIRRSQDKFYTNAKAVSGATERLHSVIRTLGISCDDAVAVEPSAGSGAFLPTLRKMGFGEVRAFDIAPEAADIEERDFLGTPMSMESGKRHVAVVGNPPFGKRSRLAIDFVNHAFDGGAQVVAFILPVQMRKWASQKAVRDGARLVLDADMPPNSFVFDGKPCNIRSCFHCTGAWF